MANPKKKAGGSPKRKEKKTEARQKAVSVGEEKKKGSKAGREIVEFAGKGETRIVLRTEEHPVGWGKKFLEAATGGGSPLRGEKHKKGLGKTDEKETFRL